MTTSLQYFMLIAKERSLVRAAEQLYISPQNLSNHVKRLEKEYGVLFDRYPHFRLTPAGEALLETLQKISILEQGLDDQLKELNEDMIGHIHFGIHALRAQIVLPRVMSKFVAAFPNVHVSFHLQNMVKNIKMLQNGDIDAFFGVDTPALSDFSIVPLETEPIYFVASSELLRKNGIAPDATELKQEFLPRFSYLLSPNDSHFRPKINLFCEQAGVVLNEMVTISDFSMQLNFASRGLGACFTPKTVLSLMNELNRSLPADKSLTALKVEGLTSVTNLSFVTHRLAYRSAPLKGFIRAFQDVFSEGF